MKILSPKQFKIEQDKKRPKGISGYYSIPGTQGSIGYTGISISGSLIINNEINTKKRS